MKEFLGSNAMEALRAGRRGAAPVVSEEHSGPAPRDGARPWADLAPGVRGMGLHYDHLVGTMVYMVRMEPGTHCPAAVDGTPEDCLVVSGDLCLGDVILRAGDNHHAPGSVIHGGGQTEAGAVVLIRARDASLGLTSP